MAEAPEQRIKQQRSPLHKRNGLQLKVRTEPFGSPYVSQRRTKRKSSICKPAAHMDGIASHVIGNSTHGGRRD